MFPTDTCVFDEEKIGHWYEIALLEVSRRKIKCALKSNLPGQDEM